MIDPVSEERRILERATTAFDNPKVCEAIPGRTYRHLKSGGLYTLLFPAYSERNLVQVAVYRSRADGKVWNRPLSEFCDGRFVLEDDTSPVDIIRTVTDLLLGIEKDTANLNRIIAEQRRKGVYKTHTTRSSDSSVYDEVCTVCGATDAAGDYGLNLPCPGVPYESLKLPTI